ncbi:MAG: DEAD/DEAH box helicase [Treponema sp.]|jgi:ATP-dependent RNA helicase DeaD|nr:DEAD/DEAH box helicase [Treponema sp.]
MTPDEPHPFSPFGLSEAMLGALTRKGFTAPSSIQTIALPRLLADSGHLIVKARTGTGKTAAFGIPLVEKITAGGHAPRALILTPTRELALQVSREIASLVSGQYPRITAVYGGASIRNQILDLKRGTEVVVGTPGRIMDLMDRKVLDLSAVDWFILDEADEMLDMGFFEDVEKILAAVKTDRRVALFSATMPPQILKVVRNYLGDVDILEDSAPEDEKPAVDQYYMVLKREDRLEALRRIIDSAEDFYGLVFCATKAGADELSRRLVEAGFSAEAIHGDLTQEARERTLRRFRAKQTTILVATDVAARGLDIERLTHVINYDLPNDGETYVHRIGRTGRAGRRGKAVSLALPSERGRISHLSRSMERILGSKILWMKAPSVKSVMKALRGRIVSTVAEVLPEVIGDEPQMVNGESAASAPADTAPSAPYQPPAGDTADDSASASPFLAKVCRQLIERLGAERAVEALITLNYGEQLDPSRYGTITEFAEEDFHETGRGRFEDRYRGRGPVQGRGSAPLRGGPRRSQERGTMRGAARDGQERFPRRDADTGGSLSPSVTRVYVGLGRSHGASARDIASLLMRAAGVPGRLVDDIEVKDYCAFASLPVDAARRACAFTGNKSGDNPVIRPASPHRG